MAEPGSRGGGGARTGAKPLAVLGKHLACRSVQPAHLVGWSMKTPPRHLGRGGDCGHVGCPVSPGRWAVSAADAVRRAPVAVPVVPDGTNGKPRPQYRPRGRLAGSIPGGFRRTLPPP